MGLWRETDPQGFAGPVDIREAMLGAMFYVVLIVVFAVGAIAAFAASLWSGH